MKAMMSPFMTARSFSENTGNHYGGKKAYLLLYCTGQVAFSGNPLIRALSRVG